MPSRSDSIDDTGLWWLPDDPDNPISGTLKWEPTQRPRLDLIGSFRELSQHRLDEDFLLEIILGITARGRKVTLWQCRELRSQLSMPGLYTASYSATVAIVGTHFSAPDDIRFQRLAIAYDQVDSWNVPSGLVRSFSIDKATGVGTKYSLEYTHPDVHEVEVRDLRIRFLPVLHGPSGERHVQNLRQETFIEIYLPRLESLETFLHRHFYHIRNFLSLGLGVPIYPARVQATLPPEEGESDYPIHPRRRIDVYYNFGGPGREPRPGDLLFDFPTISDHYERCLSNWISSSERLKPVHDLYFATLYAPDTYLESRFLTLVQALETYHRRTKGGTYVPDEEFERIEAALIDTLKGFELKRSIRCAFTQKIAYLNELALRRRIRQILDRTKDVVSLIVDKKSLFVGEVVDTRNYLTHFNPDLKDRAAIGVSLFFLTERVKALLEYCLLCELGLSTDLSVRLASEKLRLRQTAGLMG